MTDSGAGVRWSDGLSRIRVVRDAVGSSAHSFEDGRSSEKCWMFCAACAAWRHPGPWSSGPGVRDGQRRIRDLIRLYVADVAVKNVMERLERPTWRSKAKKQMDRSNRSKSLDASDRKFADSLVVEAVEEAVFGFFVVLDGDRVVDSDAGRLELTPISDRRVLLNDTDTIRLHDISNAPGRGTPSAFDGRYRLLRFRLRRFLPPRASKAVCGVLAQKCGRRTRSTRAVQEAAEVRSQ